MLKLHKTLCLCIMIAWYCIRHILQTIDKKLQPEMNHRISLLHDSGSTPFYFTNNLNAHNYWKLLSTCLCHWNSKIRNLRKEPSLSLQCRMHKEMHTQIWERITIYLKLLTPGHCTILKKLVFLLGGGRNCVLELF